MNFLNYVKHTKLFTITFITVFALCGLFINFVQLLLNIFVRPINRRWFRKLMYYLANIFYGRKYQKEAIDFFPINFKFFSLDYMFIFEYFSDSTMKFYVTIQDFEIIGKEKCLFITNHHYENDWIVSLFFTHKVGSLGYAVSIMKKSLRNIPIVGWFFVLSGCISLERNFKKDKDNLTESLTSLLKSSDVLAVRFLKFRNDEKFLMNISDAFVS
jgi:lysophosphatidic acid acyltransferase/lysophosphatidylinositol acyltransferase